MNHNEYIQFHYQKVAKSYGLSKASTLKDPWLRDLEIHLITDFINSLPRRISTRPLKILECGCGNGYLAQKIFEYCHHPISYTAVDISLELIELAKKRSLKNVSFHCQDAIHFLSQNTKEDFDLIITERFLINLKDQNQQKKFLDLAFFKLKKGGRVLTIESYKEKLVNLNTVLNENGFKILHESRHNNYLKNQFYAYAKRIGLRPIESKLITHFNHQVSNYYILTRLILPLLKKDGAKNNNIYLKNYLKDAFIVNNDLYNIIKAEFFHKIY